MSRILGNSNVNGETIRLVALQKWGRLLEEKKKKKNVWKRETAEQQERWSAAEDSRALPAA